MKQAINHVAVIMDGNRRWAEQNNLPESRGYTQGVQSIKDIIESSVENKISYLTLFVFSTENWKRSSLRLQNLFNLMLDHLRQNETLLMSEKIRIHLIGDISPLPKDLQKAFLNISKKTQSHKKLHLILAINYGGRREVLEAASRFCLDHNQKNKNPKKKRLKEEDFEKYLQSSQFPDPDLIIRTGGVQRLSNFYLWSAAYSELYFTNVLWPKFDKKEFKKAIQYYQQVKRTFGGA